MFSERSDIEYKVGREIYMYIENLHQVGVILVALLKAWLYSQKHSDLSENERTIQERIEKAEKIRIYIIEYLSGAIFSRRSDYLNLIFELKKIEDYLAATYSRISIYRELKSKIPKEVKEKIGEITELLILSSRFLLEASAILNSESVQALQYYEKISDLEKRIDKIRWTTLAMLYGAKKISHRDWNMIVDILAHLDEIGDHIESVASILYLISVG
ncbi:MAG: DUF47 family protein [Candidatus Korarchaeota archaeon]